MITEIRKQFKAQGFKVILGLVLIAMCISFLPVFKQQGPGERGAIMTIDTTAIGPVDFERKAYQINERLQFFSEQLGFKFDLKNVDVRSIAIQSLVEETLLNKVANQLGLVISPLVLQYKLSNPEYVMYELADVMPWYVVKDGHINEQALTHYLRTIHMTMSDFEETIEQAMKRALIKDVVGASTYVLPQELKDYFMQHYVPKTFKILTLPLSIFTQKAAAQQLDQKAIQAFFDAQNKKSKRYWVPEQRAGKAWVFTPESYDIKISDEDIKKYYDSHKLKKYVDKPVQIQVRSLLFAVPESATPEQVSQIEERAQKVLDQARKSPADFAQLVKEHSDDSQALASGGLTEFFQKGQRNPEFEKAAFRLKENNQISDLVVTDRGLEIIQRVDRKPTTFKSLELVRKAIEDQLRRQKFNIQFSTDLNRLIRSSDDEQAINAFAQKKNATSQQAPMSKKKESAVTTKLFEVTKGGWTYFFNDGRGYALKLTDVKKRYKPDLKDVQERVVADLKEANARKAFESATRKAEKMAQATTSLEEVQKELGGAVQMVGPVKKDDNQKLEALRHLGINTASIFELAGTDAVMAQKSEDQVNIIKVTGVGVFDQAQFDAVKSEIEKTLYKERSADAIQGFVASLYRNATIKMMDTNNDN